MANNRGASVYDVEYKFKVNAIDRYEAEREAEEIIARGDDSVLGKIDVFFSADNYYDY